MTLSPLALRTSRRAAVYQLRGTLRWTWHHWCRHTLDQGAPYVAVGERYLHWAPAYLAARRHMKESHGEDHPARQR